MNHQSIRGTRIGAGALGDSTISGEVERLAVSYWDVYGNETVRYYSIDIDPEEIPEQIDSPKTGLPAGRDRKNPPQPEKNEPYKTHLAYVKERRTPEEGERLLEEALQKLRARRGQALLDATNAQKQ